MSGGGRHGTPMPEDGPESPDPAADYAFGRLTHHATAQERAEALRRRPGRPSNRAECVVIGHAWTHDPHRDGGAICMVCHVVRFP